MLTFETSDSGHEPRLIPQKENHKKKKGKTLKKRRKNNQF